MNKKIYLIVILAIVITTLSQTVSFISGEHKFYSTVQDKCIKCHGDIKTQLSTSAQHSSYSCTFCHAKSATNHTNIKPMCNDCHSPRLNDTFEAHDEFVSLGSEGCIACHTTYNVIVNFSRPEYIDYDIVSESGMWIVANFTMIGELNLSNNAMREGGNHNLKNVSCLDCHKDIFDAVSLGGHAIVLGKDGKQAAKHDTNNSATMQAWCLSCHNSSDAVFQTQQHAARKTTCDGCHEAYGKQGHPGDFISTGIKTVPRLYRSLVCISCKSAGWQNPGNEPDNQIHFRVHQEPYFDVVVT